MGEQGNEVCGPGTEVRLMSDALKHFCARDQNARAMAMSGLDLMGSGRQPGLSPEASRAKHRTLARIQPLQPRKFACAHLLTSLWFRTANRMQVAPQPCSSRVLTTALLHGRAHFWAQYGRAFLRQLQCKRRREQRGKAEQEI
eukprot:234060-Hanusia_phi.AAC.2